MEVVPIKIEELKLIKNLYSSVIKDLNLYGIDQWDRYYPNRFIISNDIKRQHAFGIKEGEKCIAVIVLDEKQSSKYKKLKWQEQKGKPICIHRLAVHPEYQGKGIGKTMLQYAEEYAINNGYTSIRLDVYSNNSSAVNMYYRAGYKFIGDVKFPFRRHPYLCLEKILITNEKE